MSRSAARSTSRLELRAPPARVARIHHAARLVQQSTSAFMLDAASRRAEEVIAAATETVVPADFFDRLWKALDERPRPNAALARRARARRQGVQR